MLSVWQILIRQSERFVRELGVGLTISGRIYLWRLLWRAAVQVSRAEREGDRAALERAEVALRRLLMAAAGLSFSSGPETELGLFLGAVGGSASRRISAADLKAALRQLCPIWPFC
jgi:hypothetical protein